MTRYYVDTCIWRDYLESREDRLRPLGEFAYQFIKRSIDRHDTILYSWVIMEELSLKYPRKEIDICVAPIRDAKLLEEVEISGQNLAESKKLSIQRNVPRGDALHALAARENNAVIITRDRHFELLRDIAASSTPEEIT